MNQKEQKRFNQLQILKLIRMNEPISQVELADLSGLRASTVSYIIRELKAKQQVVFAGKGDSTALGGKKKHFLSINPAFGTFAGIFIKSEKIFFNIVDFKGNIIETHQCNIENFNKDQITIHIKKEIDKYQNNRPNYKGTGIAVSSVVDEEGDIVVSSDFDWSVSHFKEKLVNEQGTLPLVVENDANCAVYKAYFYLKEQYSNLITFLCYKNPVTVGSGIMLNRNIFRGPRGAAGEVFKNGLADSMSAGFYQELEKTILQAATLLDSEAVVINGDLFFNEDNTTKKFLKSLKAQAKHFDVHFIPDTGLPITGAAMLAAESYLNMMF